MEQPGAGLIETMRVREGAIPFLAHHLARLERSLAELRLPRPRQDPERLVKPFAGIGNAVVRLEVSDGRASVTVRDVPPLAPPAVITAAEPHEPYPHKTTARGVFTDATNEAELAEADDALLLTPDGYVAEGTVWNVFWWDGGVLRTPALELGILPGIARARVLELFAQVDTGAFPRAALRDKSLFLTNAVRGVVPIATLDGVPVPADCRTTDLATRFWPERLNT